ncbi:flavin-containing monooxygenase [Marinibactrum halimedae]|uniref:NAD(P)/FAD-dependent oxidoreductase n=1 Tax=Marinibactrum halimedae TaxID=1444977 RepID=A0AA37WP78_9GAMM|nr:SidA/IucD/PvdA family monooxygenase [Marinibactrum halimedae]MCD9459287.1 SidA/IucD/PvdA family monooxygenase [Marinibactrum halimedae]GLS25822.1 hypothetical protein GCM10007877_15360 [Marinibactrum halimedae]
MERDMLMDDTDRIVVVGAGLSGLAALKELLEAGLNAVCYEKRLDIGGVFSEGGTYDSVELTVSNYFMAYSDLMPYGEEVRFWSRKEYKDYLDKYAEKFHLRERIIFDRTLDILEEHESGQWTAHFKNSHGVVESVTAQRVVICSGQFQKPNIPSLKGLDSFNGPVIHSSQYKNAELLKAFHNKKVLCFGMGESAADVIAEVASVAKKTILSLRRHHMFSSRYVSREKKKFGYATIDVLQSRYYHSLPAALKTDKVRKVAQDAVDHPSYEDGKPTARQLMCEHVLSAGDEPGSVVTKTERIFEAQSKYDFIVDATGVERIEGHKVTFISGKEETFDAILLCTGFRFDLPFLPERYQFKDIRDCYLQMFHPNLKETVSFVGFARPQQGGVPLMAEMQSRYLAQVLNGQKTLPEDMADQAHKDADKWRHEFYETPNVFGLVNGLRFNEHLAELIGCVPPVPNILLSPQKYFCYWFSHVWPSQYRLQGPGAREEAKQHWHKAPSATGWKQNVKSWLMMLYLRRRKGPHFDEKHRWRPILPR